MGALQKRQDREGKGPRQREKIEKGIKGKNKIEGESKNVYLFHLLLERGQKEEMIRKIKQLGNGEKSSGRIWKFFLCGLTS